MRDVEVRWQRARLSRRGLLVGLAISASAGVLAACSGGGTTTAPAAGPTAASGGAAGSTAGSGAATAATGGAATGATAATSAGATAAPAVQSSGTATTVVWFAARDTTGYTPKQVEAFNQANKSIQIGYQEQGAMTQDLHDKFVTVAGARTPAWTSSPWTCPSCRSSRPPAGPSPWTTPAQGRAG